ncbi:MAG: Gfo/Idh/MocA family protein [Rubripirellula sp.]
MRSNQMDLSRREFLVAAAAATATSTVASHALAAGPNDRMRVAFIGVGGRGGRNLKTIASSDGVDVIALCDVDRRFLENTGELFPKARQFRDFRKLYDALGKDVDAVVVSTPEHTHAYATMPALQLGKHVYCEKPLAYNVYETRRVTEAAAAAGVVTQMGTQIHATENYHRVVELIQSGAIGDVTEAHVWVDRAWGLQSESDSAKHKDKVFVQNRPEHSMEPPEYIDWDLWLGPAPARPFHEVYFPGPKWYRWWDFGNGTMSDLGSHWNDLPFWALKLDAPRTVEAFGPPPHPEIAPASMTAVYEYGSRGDLPPVTLTWHQGANKPEQWKNGEIPQWRSGVLFVGSKGMLISDYRKHQLLPEENFRDFTPPEPFLPVPAGHHEEWIAACRGQGKTGSPFSYAGPLTEANHLGNVAFRVGKKITWDAAKMECVGCPQAAPMLRREPREGWSLS